MNKALLCATPNTAGIWRILICLLALRSKLQLHGWNSQHHFLCLQKLMKELSTWVGTVVQGLRAPAQSSTRLPITEWISKEKEKELGLPDTCTSLAKTPTSWMRTAKSQGLGNLILVSWHLVPSLLINRCGRKTANSLSVFMGWWLNLIEPDGD